MKKSVPSLPARLAPALLAAMLVLAGCRSSTAPERHIRPSAVVATANGTEVARAETGGSVTGSFVVTAGGQTDLLTFTFLDAQGNEVEPPSDYHLELRFADNTFASFVADGSPYTFRGRIQGLEAGSTTVQVRLMHGPPGHVATHADYTSPSIPVQVN